MSNEKKVYVVDLKRPLKLTAEDIDDIMAGSLEGGFTRYWCNAVEVKGEYLGEYASEQISHGGTLVLHDSEEGETHELNLDKFLEGFRIWVEKGYDEWGAVSETEIDTCNIDGIAADAIVQCAIFGDVIYG